MARNFGIGGSPARKTTDPVEKLDVTDVQGLEGAGKEGGEEHFVVLDAEDKSQKLRKNTSSSKLDLLSEKLGGTWTKNKQGQFRNQDGMTVSQVENQIASKKFDAI